MGFSWQWRAPTALGQIIGCEKLLVQRLVGDVLHLLPDPKQLGAGCGLQVMLWTIESAAGASAGALGDIWDIWDIYRSGAGHIHMH